MLDFLFGTGFHGQVASEWVIFGFYLVAVGFSIYSAIRGADATEVNTTGPRVEDNKLTVSTLGTPKPICYGTVRISGNIIWAGDLEEEVVETTTTQGGGKGGFGGGGGITTTARAYLYYRSVAIAWGEGASGCTLLKLFANGKLVYDREGTDAVQVEGVSLYWYEGSETQDVDPIIEADVGTSDCPAYRGTCYCVLDRFPLADFGNAMPNFTAVITFNYTAAYPTTDLGGITYHFNGAYDERSDAAFFIGTNNGSGSIYQLSRFSLADNTLTHKINLNDTLGTSCGKVAVLPISGLIAVVGGTNFGVFDPNSLELLAEATHTYGPYLNSQGCATIGHQITGMDYILCPGQNQRVCAYKVSSDPEAPVITKILDIPVGDLSRPSGYHQGYTYANDAAADRDGYAWITGCVQAGALADAEPVIWKFGLSAEGELTELQRIAISHTDIPSDSMLKNCGYDPATHSLVILCTNTGTNQLFRWDIETESILWLEKGTDYSTNYVCTADACRLMFKHNILDSGVIWLACASTTRYLREFRISDGTMLREYTPDTWFSINITRCWLYHQPTHSFLGNDQTDTDFVYTRGYLDRGSGAGVGLDAVVSDLCVRAGLTTNDIVVTDLSIATDSKNLVRGYRVTRRASARAAIETLTKGYFFDAVESDFLLKFFRRENPSLDTGLTIPENDLGVGIDAPGEHFLEEERVQDEEIPVQYDMRFINPDLDYQEDGAIAQRILSPIMHCTSQGEHATDLPIVFTGSEARRIAERWLATAWTERTMLTFSMLPKWLRADPTDIFEVIANSVTRDVRLIGVRVGESFDLQADAVVVDQDSYTSTDSTGAVSEFTPQEIEVLTNSYVFALDLPLLEDQHDSASTIPVYYSSRSIASSGWPGGVTLKSNDLVSWTQLGAFTQDDAYGVAIEALGDWTSGGIDTVNTVQVQLAHSGLSLSSITQAELVAGGNPAMLGNELIQFQNATDKGNDVWELDTFLRGRRGTEWATGDHSAGARFLFLGPGSIGLHHAPLADLNTMRYYRAISLGASTTTGHTFSLATSGVALKPYAPVNVGAVRDSTNSKLLVYWTRRSRTGGEIDWTQDVEVPVGEATEVYEVDLLHKTTGEVEGTYTTTAHGSRQSTSYGVTFSIPSAGKMRMVSGYITESSYTDAKLVRVIGAQDAGNNGTFLIDNVTATQLDVENANAVARSNDAMYTKIIDEICEQVTIPAADLTSAGYTGITDSIDVVVYQISAIVGRGHGTSATV